VVSSITLGYVLFGVYEDRSSGGPVNFQEYEPLTLPPNINIKSRHINVWTDKDNSFLPHYTKQLDIDLNSTGTSSIIEQKNINFRYTCDPEGLAVNETCVLLETSRHQRYRLTTLYEQAVTNAPFEQEVEWLKGSTYIWITLQGSPVQTNSPATWDKVIDSFVPTHYSNLPINYYFD